MDRLDDPLDSSLKAWPDEPEGWAEIGADLALVFGSLVFAPAEIVKVLKDRFFQPNRIGRVMYLFEGLVLKLKAIESEHSQSREKIKEIQAQLETPRFNEAIAAACEEAVRATNQAKIEQLATVIAGTLQPNLWRSNQEDIASLIRDIAQLGNRDVDVLEKLSRAFGGLMLHHE